MPAVHSSQTISDALHTATLMLQRASSSPRLDAELLLEHVTGLSRTSFHSHPERELPANAGWSLQQLVKRRMHGEPVAYIRGQQEFWSLLFEVSPAVLIPRPETELLVERALAHIDVSEETQVADLGTGSGAIAISIAHERPKAKVTASDLSADALMIATRNTARLQVQNVKLVQGSWFAPFAEQKLDVIVSNPPYVAETDTDLAPGVRRYEPHIALFAARNGLDALSRIASDARTHLRPNGWLLLEHGWKQATEVRDLLERAGFDHVRSHPDLAGHERVTEGRIGSG
jgi:release factor glutamine methyltransferase